MKKIYGFLWHVDSGALTASEGSAGAYCQSFETESEDALAAETIIRVFVQRHMVACQDSGCEHTPIITRELTPKMIMAGMTANMRKVETPASKRELVLRVMSALGKLPPDKLTETLKTFPSKVKRYLNDSGCLRKPSPKEIKDFDLGNKFLAQEYPRVKKLLER
jgi:hypothetical protein